MGKKDDSNLGEDIKNIVQEALSSTDFKQLNQNIKNTVNNALDEAKKSIKESQEKYQQTSAADTGQIEKTVSPKPKVMTARELKAQKKARNKLISPSPTGSVTGMMLKAFGGIGMIGFGSFAAYQIVSVIGSGTLGDYAVSLPMLSIFFIISTIAFFTGKKFRNRVLRFRQYVKHLGKHDYCSIKTLASGVGKSENFVFKDIMNMIHLRMFPKGRISEERNYFILSDEAYTEYVKMQEGVRLLKEEEENEKQARLEREAMEKSNPALRDINRVIDEGEDAINQIRAANDVIAGETISKKLDRLELILRKIFIYVKNHPSEVSEIRKFMGYYLPTTLKLVNAYKELDDQPIQGENIKTAKGEIEGTLDTINQAFENLLDSFFEDTALDISTDITVLETIFAQEGLTEKDFKNGGN
ncbi:MAG: 5-bromo-4-chloroindolyl phosphate hydrolysis family protein [Eubacterium sp.]